MVSPFHMFLFADDIMLNASSPENICSFLEDICSNSKLYLHKKNKWIKTVPDYHMQLDEYLIEFI